MSTDHAPQCHIYTLLEHFQEWWLHHLPGQPVPIKYTLMSYEEVRKGFWERFAGLLLTHYILCAPLLLCDEDLVVSKHQIWRDPQAKANVLFEDPRYPENPTSTHLQDSSILYRLSHGWCLVGEIWCMPTGDRFRLSISREHHSILFLSFASSSPSLLWR